MRKNSRIYIAGHTGMVGSALMEHLTEKGYKNIIVPTEKFDLCDKNEVCEWFRITKPEYVFICAAKVGGIKANNSHRADFIYDNLMIQTNLIDAAYLFDVRKLMFLGSSCIYPKHCPQPIREEYLLGGYLEQTNEPYAVLRLQESRWLKATGGNMDATSSVSCRVIYTVRMTTSISRLVM